MKQMEERISHHQLEQYEAIHLVDILWLHTISSARTEEKYQSTPSSSFGTQVETLHRILRYEKIQNETQENSIAIESTHDHEYTLGSMKEKRSSEFAHLNQKS